VGGSAGEDLARGSFGCLDRLLASGHLLAYRFRGLDADIAIPEASTQGREQIGARWGAITLAFPDGRLTELLRD